MMVFFHCYRSASGSFTQLAKVKKCILVCRTLFVHTNFQFNYQGDKKVDNSGGLCSIGGMSEGNERIVAEHPKAWVVRMVEGRGLKVAEKTL
jgi:hypothetical protein